MAGLKVIGTAGSAEGLEIVLKEGADHVLNHREDGYLDKVWCCLPAYVGGACQELDVKPTESTRNSLFFYRFCFDMQRGPERVLN